MACGDCSADSQGYSKEPACHLQPGDSSQPGTPSSQEPSPSEHPHSPLHPSRGPLYPSNHDRMRAALKKPVVPLDGKGNGALSSEGHQLGGCAARLTWPLLSPLLGASSWTLSRLCEPDSLDLQPSSVLTPGKPELMDAASGSPDVPAEGQHLLLSNGHLPQACDSGSESTPLTGQPPGRRNTPLLFAPKS